jgi:N-formylglutamate deformylase
LRGRCADVLAAQSQFSSVIDGRFKGGYITRHYGRPAQGWHAIQMEMTWSSYLDESRPQHWDPIRAEPARRVLQSLIETLLQWRPD